MAGEPWIVNHPRCPEHRRAMGTGDCTCTFRATADLLVVPGKVWLDREAELAALRAWRDEQIGTERPPSFEFEPNRPGLALYLPGDPSQAFDLAENGSVYPHGGDNERDMHLMLALLQHATNRVTRQLQAEMARARGEVTPPEAGAA